MTTLASDLASIKRMARLRGRPVTKQEVAGAVQGQADAASERLARAKSLSLEEKGLTQEKELAEIGFGLQEQELAQTKELELGSQALTAESLAQAKELAEAQMALSSEQFEAEMEQRKYETEEQIKAANKNSGLCIIISTCTSPESYPVALARIYRDEYMRRRTLGGYYALCEIVVPFIRKFDKVKKFCKKHLVDNFIEYGEWFFHIRNTASKRSKIITKGFLSFCNVLGRFVNTDKFINKHR